MILNDIEEALKSFGLPVYYGMQNIAEREAWNYFVFRRTKTSATDSKRSAADHIVVACVHEGYVEPGMDERIAAVLEPLPGVKLSSADISYDYTAKPGTNIVVEVMAMEFTMGRKRG